MLYIFDEKLGESKKSYIQSSEEVKLPFKSHNSKNEGPVDRETERNNDGTEGNENCIIYETVNKEKRQKRKRDIMPFGD